MYVLLFITGISMICGIPTGNDSSVSSDSADLWPLNFHPDVQAQIYNHLPEKALKNLRLANKESKAAIDEYEIHAQLADWVKQEPALNLPIYLYFRAAQVDISDYWSQLDETVTRLKKIREAYNALNGRISEEIYFNLVKWLLPATRNFKSIKRQSSMSSEKYKYFRDNYLNPIEELVQLVGYEENIKKFFETGDWQLNHWEPVEQLTMEQRWQRSINWVNSFELAMRVKKFKGHIEMRVIFFFFKSKLAYYGTGFPKLPLANMPSMLKTPELFRYSFLWGNEFGDTKNALLMDRMNHLINTNTDQFEKEVAHICHTLFEENDIDNMFLDLLISYANDILSDRNRHPSLEFLSVFGTHWSWNGIQKRKEDLAAALAMRWLEKGKRLYPNFKNIDNEGEYSLGWSMANALKTMSKYKTMTPSMAMHLVRHLKKVEEEIGRYDNSGSIASML